MQAARPVTAAPQRAAADGGGARRQMTEPAKAVFLSYASQDAEAAQRICEAVRAAGIEVWFDQCELRGGDAWDQSIRRQIKTCALFIPVISKHTHERVEGYFRLEWKLAVDRSHLILSNKAFLLPVVIDDTSDRDEHVPEKFHEVQWTRLPGGETSPSFVERITRLLTPEAPPAAALAAAESTNVPTSAHSLRRSSVPKAAVWTAGAIAAIAFAYMVADKFWLSKRAAPSSTTSSTVAAGPAVLAIPEKSIAVLPFVDMSEKHDQEYFSDGLTEELIDMLTKVSDLRVPARTSSFYFKGRNEAIANIAQQLKVAHVLEGSVRKAGKRLRITAQLIRVDDGYHVWSEAYDRDDADVFAVQDDIARAVVGVLQVKLARGAQEADSRGTTNAEAYDQYLLGRQHYRHAGLEGARRAVGAYRKAIVLDPNYAAAYAGLAVAEGMVADFTGDTRAGIERASHDADKAIALAGNDPAGYAARSFIRTTWLWEWPGAQADIEKALSLDPRNSDAQHWYARLLGTLGRLPEAIASLKKATELDPLSSIAWTRLGYLYIKIGDYKLADSALNRGIEIDPTSPLALNILGTLRLLQGRDQEALEAFRKIELEPLRPAGIAMAEHTLGDAKASQQALEELIAKHAQSGAYQVGQVFAWRGEKVNAFEWLERAYQQRDGGLSEVKSDPLLASLRGDPHWAALLRKMNLPE